MKTKMQSDIAAMPDDIIGYAIVAAKQDGGLAVAIGGGHTSTVIGALEYVKNWLLFADFMKQREEQK